VTKRGEEAGAAAGVAGDAGLLDEEEDGVAVAIVAQIDQPLCLPGRLALAPERLAAATIIADLPCGDGLPQ
jgi:hypothetical protein